MQLENKNVYEYLKETEFMDFSHPLLQKLIDQRFKGFKNATELIRGMFEFVRDEIHHSWDIQSRRITIEASDVLMYREGVCYAKSILLAALLRCKGVPTGFCYQRIIMWNAPEPIFGIHALNAVYLDSEDKWIRLDARGNTGEINAEFSTDSEKLAYPIRKELKEVDYSIIYSNPHIKTISVLSENTDCIEMCKYKVPTEL